MPTPAKAKPPAQTPKALALPPYLTVAEAAELLRVTQKAIRHLIDRGKLPGVRRPDGLRKVLLHTATVLAWLESGASSLHTR